VSSLVNICILDDDSTLACHLYNLILKYSSERKLAFTIDIYYNGDSLLDSLYHSDMPYHIYFLDILMQGKNGIQVAREIRKLDKTAHIIFLTSSPEYALEGYEVRAYNYLLKPLKKEQLYNTLSELLGTKNAPPAKQLQITNNGVVKNIPYRNIVYIEVKRNKLLLILNTGDEIETYSTITEMFDLLKDEEIFTRTHRSFIINMQYIKEFSSTTIRLQPDYYIPVSRTYSTSARNDYFAFAKAFFS